RSPRGGVPRAARGGGAAGPGRPRAAALGVGRWTVRCIAGVRRQRNCAGDSARDGSAARPLSAKNDGGAARAARTAIPAAAAVRIVRTAAAQPFLSYLARKEEGI